MDARIRDRSRRQVGVFFLLFGLCSLPLWVLGALSDATLTSQLSIASLMIVAPFMAALLLTWRQNGRAAVRALLLRAGDPRLQGGLRWYLPVIALLPAATVLEVALLRVSGRVIPGFEVAPAVLLVDLALYWIAATLEEVGWTGYATDRLRSRYSMLATSLLLGVVWIIWHIPAMLAMPSEPAWSFIALQCGVLMAMRIIMVWVYEGSGHSLFAVIALHAVSNASMMTIFPVYGSHYDPFAALVVLSIVAAAVLGLPKLVRAGRNQAPELASPGRGSSVISSEPVSRPSLLVSSMISPKPVDVAQVRTSSRTLSSKRMMKPRGS